MILQLLLGGVSGIYVFFRIFKQKILGFFGIHTEESQPTASQLKPVAENDPARRQV
jgi:hypothetical protein